MIVFYLYTSSSLLPTLLHYTYFYNSIHCYLILTTFIGYYLVIIILIPGISLILNNIIFFIENVLPFR